MSRWLVVTVLLHCLVVPALAALPSDGTRNNSCMTVSEVQQLENGVAMTLAFDAPVWSTQDELSGNRVLAEFADSGQLTVDGQSIVPMLSQFVRMPARGGLIVDIRDADYDLIEDVDYAIYVNEESENPVEPVDAWFPENIVDVGTPALFHDFRVASVNTCPVQVNPARRQARVYRSIDLEIEYSSQPAANELDHWPTEISRAFLPFYRNFLDWDENELDEYTLYNGGMQVVLRNAAVESFQPWLEWKRQMGWDISLLTEDDAPFTSTGIKAELEWRYMNADPKFDFVVVVGDANGPYSVPPGGYSTTGGTQNYWGDFPYGAISGTDDIVDVAVGRISVESEAQLVGYMNKVFGYEKNPYTADSGWYNRGLLASGAYMSGRGIFTTILMGRYARELMLDIGYTQVDTAWYNDGLGAVNPRIVNRINSGVSFFCFRRGGINTGLDDSDIYALNNPFKLPFVLDITCETGNWYNDLGFTEAWMRAGTPTTPKGAIGAIGTATTNTFTRENNALTGGALESVLQHHNPYMGMSWVGAILNLYKNTYEYNADRALLFFFYTNLMGDPTLRVWTDQPHPLTVDAPESIDLGINGISVTVQKYGEPLADAWVCVEKHDGGEEVCVKGVTDASGQLYLDVPIRSEGTATLTITGQNVHPVIRTLAVTSSDRIGFVETTILDDGSQGTDGNGNGLPEAGETVGLLIRAHNFGNVSQSTVTASAVSEDGWITVGSQTATFPTLAADGEALATSPILVEIDPTAQDGWSSQLIVTFSNGSQTWEDELKLALHAPKYALVQTTSTTNVTPGSSFSYALTLENVSESDATSGTAVLTSLHPYLSPATQTVAYGTCSSGSEVTIGQFNLTMHSLAFRGFYAPVRLVLTNADGQCDTLLTSITLGNRASSDPVGPDRYGYMAYDNTDVTFEKVPEYDWVEINMNAPDNDFDGQRLEINDATEDHDDSVLITLPFTFQYYGEEFDQITISGNGFIAMGDQRDQNLSRNWSIPSPLGPTHMIAPLWDDRTLVNGGGVYVYHDQTNGRYIIEWYHSYDYYFQSDCTFELVLYDRTGDHITPTEDNEFLFQFKTVNPSTGPYGTHESGGSAVPYFTTGIENGDQTDGIQCYYWATSMPGMAPATTGRAILFTTAFEQVFGTVSGRVTTASGNQPVSGVTVQSENGFFHTITDENGDYSIPDIAVGVHNMMVVGPCINTVLHSDVEIEESQTTPLDFSVTIPQFALQVDELNVGMGPDNECVVPIVLENAGDGPTDYNVRMMPIMEEPDLNGEGVPILDELDEEWDPFGNFDLDESELRNRGMTHDSKYFWVSGSDNFDATGPNKLYRYSNTGELLSTYDQPVPVTDVVGIYDMAWDGQYLYGAVQGVMYQMWYASESVSLVDSWEIPSNPARYLAYDPTHDWFWMGDYNTPIYAVDRDGVQQQQFEIDDFTVMAIGFLPGNPSGREMFVATRDPEDQTFSLFTVNPEYGDPVLETQLPADGDLIKSIDISYQINPAIWTLSVMFNGEAEQDYIRVWEMGPSNWISFDQPTGTIPAASNLTINMTVHGIGLVDGVYQAWLRFDHHTCDQLTWLPVEVTVDQGVAGEVEPLPLEWALQKVYPNPFNATSNVQFCLKEKAHIQLALYNILGQKVAMIQNATLSPGIHTVSFDASHLASGLYFVRMDAANFHAIQKVVLMK